VCCTLLYRYNIANLQGTIIQNASKKNMPAISPGSILLLINIFIIVLINNSEIKIIGKALDRFIYISLPYVSKRDVQINIVEKSTPNIMHSIISIPVNLK